MPMHRKGEHTFIISEDRSRPITLMNVSIYNQNPLHLQITLQYSRGDSTIVVYAIPSTTIGTRMVGAAR